MSEYVDDVPYIRHFVPDLSPSRLRLAAAMNGVKPPPADDFDYCELGCAHGDTIVALAAANPRARFIGVDLAPAHITSAKKLARDAGLENVGLVAHDFEALLAEDIGTFDYVTAHGVLSWVSPAKRKALLELARTKLKPGGLLHVSYNAMPGWSSVEPLRQLLLFGATDQTNLERARRGLAFARSMADAHAEYFAKNPAAVDMLEGMTRVGLPYVVHEYMHEHWAPMYFARVASEMAEQGLHFAGVLPIHLNFRDSAISEAQEKLLAPYEDRVTFESLKDFALNEFFRRDVYVKGKAARSTDATSAYLDATTWSTLSNPPPEGRVVKLPHRTMTFTGATWDVIFRALSEGPQTVRALAGRNDLPRANMDDETLRSAIRRLLLGELVIPVRDGARAAKPDAQSATKSDSYRVPSTFNQSTLRRLSGDAPLLMASTVAGTAFSISALEGLAIRVLTEAAPKDRDAWIRAVVDRNVLRLRIGDRVIEAPDEQVTAIVDAVTNLRKDQLQMMLELGVIERVREG